MKPKLLKKFGRTRMRKLSSSDCSTRKSSLDISEGPSAGFNDSSSSFRTVTAVENRPEQEEALPADQTTYTYVNDNASSIPTDANQVHAAVHHLPAPPATQPPVHVPSIPINNETSFHPSLSSTESAGFHLLSRLQGRGQSYKLHQRISTSRRDAIAIHHRELGRRCSSSGHGCARRRRQHPPSSQGGDRSHGEAAGRQSSRHAPCHPVDAKALQ